MLGDLAVYQPALAPWLMLICGLLLAFVGRRLVPLALVLSAIAAGLLYGGAIIGSFTNDPGILRFGPLVLAVVFSVIALLLYRLAFFVAGFFLGLFIAGIFLPSAPTLAAVGIALGMGALVYFFRNFVFSVLTALIGASLTASGSVNLLERAGISTGITVYWAIAIGIGLFGALHQMRQGRKSK